MKAKILKTLCVALGGALLASCASAKDAQNAAANPPPSFVVLKIHAMVHVADIQDRSWARDNSILLHTYRGLWYRATLIGGCINRGAPSIGLVTQTGDMLDRGSSAIVEGQTCPFASLDKIQPPPANARS